ncbi:MAG: ExbD/TolR family protein [Pseudobdellovibrionaceae bacterium]
MKRRRFEPNLKQNSTFTLNITSMTDMFTIMLVFLLQTYSTAEVQIIPEKDIRLPASNSVLNPTESVKISLSAKELKLDQQSIAHLKDNQFSSESIDVNDSQFIKPLFEQLQKLSKEHPEKNYIKEGRLLLQAEQSLPYSTLKKVMYTASMAGFTQLKLVTLAGD